MSAFPPDRLGQFDADPDCADVFDKLRGATPAQIKSYVQSNVTDLASAKLLLAKALLVLGRTI